MYSLSHSSGIMNRISFGLTGEGFNKIICRWLLILTVNRARTCTRRTFFARLGHRPPRKNLARLGEILARLGYLGSSWRHLDSSWLILTRLGAILASSWLILAPSWLILASSWLILTHLGVILTHLGVILTHLGSSWRHLDVILTHLGSSWLILASSWRHLGVILAPSWRIFYFPTGIWRADSIFRLVSGGRTVQSRKPSSPTDNFDEFLRNLSKQCHFVA